jgi:hypothetical protein
MHAELVSHIMSLDHGVQQHIAQTFCSLLQRTVGSGPGDGQEGSGDGQEFNAQTPPPRSTKPIQDAEEAGSPQQDGNGAPANLVKIEHLNDGVETKSTEQDGDKDYHDGQQVNGLTPETAQEIEEVNGLTPETAQEIEDAGDQWLEETQQNKKIDWKAVLQIEDDKLFEGIEKKIQTNAQQMFDQQQDNPVKYFELEEAQFFLFGCYFQMNEIEMLLEVLANDSQITINPDDELSFYKLLYIVEHFKVVKRTYNWVCRRNAIFFKQLQDTGMDSTDSTSNALEAMVAEHVSGEMFEDAEQLLMNILGGYKVDMEAVIFQHKAITRKQSLNLKIHFEEKRYTQLKNDLNVVPAEEKLELPVVQISETAQRDCWKEFFEDYQVLKNDAELNKRELTQKEIIECLRDIVEGEHGFDLLSWNGFKYSVSPYEAVPFTDEEKDMLEQEGKYHITEVEVEDETKLACFEQMHLVMQARNIDAVAFDQRLSRYNKMVKTEIMEAEKYGQVRVPQWRKATKPTIYKKIIQTQHNKNNHADDITQAFYSKGNFYEFFVEPVDMIKVLQEQDDACQGILANYWYYYLHEITNYVCEMNAVKAPDEAMRETDQAIIRFLCIVKLFRHLYRVVENCRKKYMATKDLKRCENILRKHRNAFFNLEMEMKENDAGDIEQSIQNKDHIKQHLSERALLASI